MKYNEIRNILKATNIREESLKLEIAFEIDHLISEEVDDETFNKICNFVNECWYKIDNCFMQVLASVIIEKIFYTKELSIEAICNPDCELFENIINDYSYRYYNF